MKFLERGQLGDAVWATAGYVANKWGFETLENSLNVDRLYPQDPSLVQLGINIVGMLFAAPAIGSVFPNKQMAAVGGQVWHFARGIKIALSKVGLTTFISGVPLPL